MATGHGMVRWSIYVDTVLPFGLRSAPKVFNAVADALEWIMQKHGILHTLHYLDDFLFLERDHCGRILQLALQICEELGVPVAPEKVKGPLPVLEFLGIILDSDKMELRLPVDKLSRLQCMVSQWSHRKSCTKRELLSLIGHLSHACKVIKPGRPFLRRLIELSTIAKELHHHVRLNLATRSDLHWWKLFLSHWNGVGLISSLAKTPPEVTVTSDASGLWGCGAICNTSHQWFSVEWGECWRHIHITIKELLPIIVASAVWGKEWRGKEVLFRCDYAAVVAIVNSGRSKHPLTMHYTRLLYLLGAVFNFSFKSVHIAGRDNVAADAISCNNSSLFLQITPAAERFPIPIPAEVKTAICQIAPNWMSENWRQLLHSILVKV